MVKIFGAVLIVAVTTFFGFSYAKRYSERPRQLRLLKAALQSLEAEIMYGHTPLSEASERLVKQMPKPLNWIFESFSRRLESGEQTVREAWLDSLQENWKLTAFKQTEYEILQQFGETLGQHDRESQQKHIRLCITHLEREEGEAKALQIQYEKMIKSLGVLAGLLIVILLL
ncbi:MULTISPECIES: stage III sporulation protein SpoIIIAB [Bacillus cereus group]|uniref:Stage III sporulation protein SpoAB n=1 Tax=Bacillus cereus TaxID=1396 RepID=A0AA44QBG7_BACCE|nr:MULTISPECIES: stage III sporulation protein SpoIIIAB [Bacillus cereus group]PFA24287.1 stage III sporulation protein SpoAB [Bacillus cereus]PFN08298.1 stage III sporulation protein SpoAB [Bacillus cereus]PFO81633.1 stage III sporulation protein SpoAB [Bacillus cereus]PFR25312.1 stage III sporulation protein SpoAB [Bacillus cereus]PFS02672.1 stage III sporulation protein SpoAB [Bacillus cereus]